MKNQNSEFEEVLAALQAEIAASRKYRRLILPEETLRDLLAQEFAHYSNRKAVIQSVRQKLHNIVAPYLGDPDYAAAHAALRAAFAAKNSQSIREFCLSMLASHASTRERIPLLEHFYKQLWEVTGMPATILDLACGMQPFALPWMGLPATCRYYAYDLHHPRIDLINDFFEQYGFPRLAFHQDILVEPPTIQADVALFFKEAHRFEQRRRGACLPFFQVLQVRWLLVSLPISSLKGTRNLEDRQRHLMQSILEGQSWQVVEIRFDNELVFCIHKS